MPRICVFCGASNVSKEHIWPAWAARYMAAEGPVQHFLNIVQDGEDDQDRSWPQKTFTLVVRAVCQNCNNGWMSSLEQEVKPFFESAFDGRGRLLHQGLQRNLAAWALKTLMMVQHQQGPARRVIPSEEYTYLHSHIEPSSHVRIWMTAYTGTISTAVGHMYGLDADVQLTPDSDRGVRDIWGGTVVFGSVVFHMLGTSIPGLLELAEMNTLNVHQLWPYERSFTWVPSPGLSDEELGQFMDGFMRSLLRLGGEPAKARHARKLP
jgi:hypothetical protein